MWGDWRDAYIHGTFVIWPPDDVRAVVNSLRERYDPASAAICEADITMTQPFVREPSEVDLATVGDVASRHEPLEIAYGSLDTFLPYPCLYVTIAPVGPLTALRAALQATGLFKPVPRHHERFMPHMTILEGSLSTEEISRLAVELRDSTPHGTFVCQEIAQVVPDASFRFSVARRFRLGGPPVAVR